MIGRLLKTEAWTKNGLSSLARFALFVVTTLAIGAGVSLFGSTLALVLIVGTLGLLLLSLVPELPFVVLVMGMSIWQPVGELVEGYAIPLTLLIGLAGLLIQQFKKLSNPSPRLLRSSVKHPASLDVLLFLFTVWVWVAISWSSNPVYGQTKALQFTAVTFLAYVMLRLFFSSTGFRIQRMAWLMTLAGIAHVLIVAYLLSETGLGNPTTLSSRMTRQAVELGFNAIAETDALVLGMLATTVLLLKGPARTRPLLLVAYVAQLAAFATYQQRGATLALIAASLYLFAFLSTRARDAVSRRASAWLPAGILFTLVIAGALFIANPQFSPEYLQEDRNVTARLRFYQLGWSEFRESPIVGIGTGATGEVLASELGFYTEEFYVHNRVLEIMLETGLLGLILAAGFTLSIFRYMWPQGVGSYPGLAAGIGLAGAALIARYTVSMFSTDLGGWNIGVWAALLLSQYQLFKNGGARDASRVVTGEQVVTKATT